MEFELSDEQRMLKDSVSRFIEDRCRFEVRPGIVDNGAFDAANWATFAELGFLGLALPETVGGMGFGPIESALVMEQMGQTLAVDPYWSIGVLTAQTLLATCDENALPMLQALVSGAYKPVLAHDEPESRGDLAWVTTRAEHGADGKWRLSGQKVAVVAGNVADHYIVSARVAGHAGDEQGISLFRVAPDTPGLKRTDWRLIDNRWASHLHLDAVEVDEHQLLGVNGQAFAAIEEGAAHALTGLCAEAVGVMERALWLTRDYLKLRKQFGQPLSTFQSLQHRMSEMLIELELARGMLHCALASLDRPLDERRRALSLAKAQIGQSGHFVCAQAIQLHGGIGVTEEYVVGHHFKRMTMINATLGSALHHTEQVADMLSRQALA
ncbi:acyl-CoA dehydrogenase [Pseudomonas silvicola]|nr:acyl-CoA dehydrogenase [Pseudomonas silvicola]